MSILKKKQAETAVRQDGDIDTLEREHADLRNSTLIALEDLRGRIEQNRIKLSNAERVLKKAEVRVNHDSVCMSQIPMRRLWGT